MNMVLEKRKSIIHVLNLIISKNNLQNMITIVPVYETDRYLVTYENKKFRYHDLVIKIDKSILQPSNTAIPVDINVKEDYRLSLKKGEKLDIPGKRVVMRVVPTRYNNLPPLYGTLIHYGWKKTAKGGVTDLKFSIPECDNKIVTANTLQAEICYKIISTQKSAEGTHGANTVVVIAKKQGKFEIGKHIHISNVKHHYREEPYYVEL